MSSVRECSPSLSMIFARCVSTVLIVIPSSAAIFLFAFPSARSRIISTSRGVGRACEFSSGSDWFLVLRKPFNTMSDTLGVRKSLPAETSFTAFTRSIARSDFKMYPRAPASRTRRTIWSDSCIVRTTTLVVGPASRICRVACRPSKSGMLISTMATSGFNVFAFSTASRPFAASPMIVQPRRARRSPRMPRRTSSWSSTTRIRSFFVPLVICGYRRAHRGATTAGINVQPAADELYSLVHARDANSKPKGQFASPQVSGNSTTFVAYLQCDPSRVALNPYLGLGTSRMPLDVREAFLNHAEQSQLDTWLHPSETRRYLQFNRDSSSLREAPRVVPNRILQSGFIQHRRVQ